MLLETLAANEQNLSSNISEIKFILAAYNTIRAVEFTSYPAEYGKLWNIRKGVFPAVGGMRKISTACLIEDVVIYGHALEGNFHFIINQDFSAPKEVKCYDAMMRNVINMTVNKPLLR